MFILKVIRKHCVRLRQPHFNFKDSLKKLMSPFQATFILLTTILSASTVLAQAKFETRKTPSVNILTEKQWKQLDRSVGRGLKWLATQQQEDGSFEAIDLAQPAVTSFCVMAFLAQGESPVSGKYQQPLTRAIDFIADQQKPNGLIANVAPRAVPIPRDEQSSEGLKPGPKPNYIPATAVYNHAISGLALCEAYGQCNEAQSKKLTPMINKAIAATLEMQRWGGKKMENVGGWRYLTKYRGGDSDLSVTGWQLMFLRSAKNAGFDVPKKSIDAAVKYVEECFLEEKDRRVHTYSKNLRFRMTRAMAGAGVLAMAHAGKHDSLAALDSGKWILKHDFSRYNSDTPLYVVGKARDRYHYGAVICTQAMFQLGGKYWERFFPQLVDVLLANQKPNGSWPPERQEPQFGSCYSTSLCILSLSVPNQMLPIFQR